MNSNIKKIQTEYNINIQANDDLDFPDDVKLIVNEWRPEHIKIEIYQDRRRTAEEFIKLYEWIIKALNSKK